MSASSTPHVTHAGSRSLTNTAPERRSYTLTVLSCEPATRRSKRESYCTNEISSRCCCNSVRWRTCVPSGSSVNTWMSPELQPTTIARCVASHCSAVTACRKLPRG